MQTELNENQKARIRFHLGYYWNLPPLAKIEPEERLRLGALPIEVIRLTVGDIDREGADLVVSEGETLATSGSLLGKLEVAYAKLSPETIEASLFVSTAGKINLRPNELRNRKKLYGWLTDELAKALGVPKYYQPNQRAGY